jgi:hypothetical protein
VSYLKKLRHEDGGVEVQQFDFDGSIFLEVHEDPGKEGHSGESVISLSPKQARRLAKALKNAANGSEASQ